MHWKITLILPLHAVHLYKEVKNHMLAPLHLVLCAASLNNKVEIMRNNSIESYIIVEESKKSESIHYYRMTPDPLTFFWGLFSPVHSTGFQWGLGQEIRMA